MSIAQVTLSGTIKKDAEQRYTPNNTMVTNFMMNVVRYDGRAKEEKAYPVKVTLWGDSYADILDRLKQGTKVIVSGRLQIDQFNDRNGKPVRLLNVEASSLNFADQIAAVSAVAVANNDLPIEEEAPATGSETDAFNDQEVPF